MMNKVTSSHLYVNFDLSEFGKIMEQAGPTPTVTHTRWEQSSKIPSQKTTIYGEMWSREQNSNEVNLSAIGNFNYKSN